MATFSSIAELEKYLNSQMASVLKNEVAQKVKDIESEKVQSEVYDKYNILNGQQQDPYVYQRRGTNGGLVDQSNMVETVVETSNGVELTVVNITKGQDNGQEIAGLIEYGDGYNGMEYDYKTNRDGTANQYLRARPFTESTEEQLLESGEHVRVFVEGMKARGIDIS